MLRRACAEGDVPGASTPARRVRAPQLPTHAPRTSSTLFDRVRSCGFERPRTVAACPTRRWWARWRRVTIRWCTRSRRRRCCQRTWSPRWWATWRRCPRRPRTASRWPSWPRQCVSPSPPLPTHPSLLRPPAHPPSGQALVVRVRAACCDQDARLLHRVLRHPLHAGQVRPGGHPRLQLGGDGERGAGDVCVNRGGWSWAGGVRWL